MKLTNLLQTDFEVIGAFKEALIAMEVWGRLLSLNEKYADVDLAEGEVWLGRGTECHPESRYNHIDVSRKHCSLSIEIDEVTGAYSYYLSDNRFVCALLC